MVLPGGNMKKGGMLKIPLISLAVIFAGIAFAADKEVGSKESFYFVQLSDTHWGFGDAKINPDYAGTLKKAIATINSMRPQPDFVVFTGDDTHTTDDPIERSKRLSEFLALSKTLKAKNIKYLPGEHDAGLDQGAAYKELIGISNYSFDHQGVHFIALDNASQPQSSIGQEGLKWLATDLKNLKPVDKIIVFTHRPLFDLYPDWEWYTKDGSQALDLLAPFMDVTVFYGHIHQLNRHTTGNIEHIAASGMMYPLPEPGSVPKKAPLAWTPEKPYDKLGFRTIEIDKNAAHAVVMEYPIVIVEKEIDVTAKKYAFLPDEIRLKKGEPVVLKLKSLDRQHGFFCRELGIREDINPGKMTEVHLIPEKAGTFNFECDVFCGSGHEDMNGRIIVSE
jgi:plastocyanin